MAQTNYDLKNVPQVEGARIAIIRSKWYGEHTESMLKACLEILESGDASKSEQHVLPGCIEIPLAARKLLQRNPSLEAIIVFGVILKGDTYHFDIVMDMATRGIERVIFEFNKPIINEIIPATHIDQVIARSSNDQANKGYEAGLAALEAIAWHRAHPASMSRI